MTHAGDQTDWCNLLRQCFTHLGLCHCNMTAHALELPAEVLAGARMQMSVFLTYHESCKLLQCNEERRHCWRELPRNLNSIIDLSCVINLPGTLQKACNFFEARHPNACEVVCTESLRDPCPLIWRGDWRRSLLHPYPISPAESILQGNMFGLEGA